MTHRILSTPVELEGWITLLRSRKLPMTVTAKAGRDRSLDQNALMWKWAGEMAEQLGDVTADDVQARWKLQVGVPILRAENEEFCTWYDAHIRHLTYEQKLECMKWVPVTRIMTVPQMTKLMDGIQRECAEQGIRLTDPEQRRAA